MAEQYLAGWPTTPCEICTAPTDNLGTKLCNPCWTLRQYVENHATHLLADPKAAPHVRALLERALATKVEPPTEAA